MQVLLDTGPHRANLAPEAPLQTAEEERTLSVLLNDEAMAGRILGHIDNGTTDLGEETWREPVAHYRSAERLEAELARVFRRAPTPFCPSAALAGPGAYLARTAAGVPILAVRGADGVVRAFRNSCRHRGTEVASGRGRGKAFVCPYHGWTYGLDGALRGVPHEYGFPDLDKSRRGLVAVAAVERDGLVFVTQDPSASAEPENDGLEGVLSPTLRLISLAEREIKANWKISAEGFLEGYHIYATHRETFFPVQYDNLNVIERFGRNGRVTFPYRNIEKLRTVPSGRRCVAGSLTFVYHLFPNVIIATFPKRIVLVVLEPVSVGVTNQVTFTLAEGDVLDKEEAAVRRDGDFVDQGALEDRAVVESIQRGLAADANEAFEFGRFEAAIVHFHRNLDAMLEAGA
jgi:phenylpropionate dioxygenase-like ring-hydroxylating dioxygenase large terminal subunit